MKVFAINGVGLSGKDTFCNFVRNDNFHIIIIVPNKANGITAISGILGKTIIWRMIQRCHDPDTTLTRTILLLSTYSRSYCAAVNPVAVGAAADLGAYFPSDSALE